jgi:hypothetical protein
MRSSICAPLEHEGGVVGILSVLSLTQGAFDELAVETTTLMAQFVAGVMRNAAELETRRKLVERLRLQGLVVEHMQTALWIFLVGTTTRCASRLCEREPGRHRTPRRDRPHDQRSCAEHPGLIGC